MEKYLKPERLDVNPSKLDAADTWRHWKKSFHIFLGAVCGTHQPTPVMDEHKLSLLINLVSPAIYKYISDISDYESAMNVLEEVFVQPKNIIFCRHLLATRKQRADENVDEYLQSLKGLAKDCDFRAVTAIQARDEYVRDAFINGITSDPIRQRLLENKSLDLHTAYEQARTLEMAQKQLASYARPDSLTASISTTRSEETDNGQLQQPAHDELPTVAALSGQKCFFCGNQRHDRSRCPARNSTCRHCKKRGHFAHVCRSPTAAAINYGESFLASFTSPNFSGTLSRSSMCGEIKGEPVRILIDTGSSENFIHPDKIKKLGLAVTPSSDRILMASSSHSSTTLGHCVVSLRLSGREYRDVKLSVMADLCCDVILGLSFLSEHSSLEIPFGGPLPPLTVCKLTAIKNVPYPSLFANLTPDCHPIAVKSRRHSLPDTKFIQSEISRMLKEEIIELSHSPWRAQALVVSPENHKKRLVVDYSQTINRFTLLDAYPLPRIEDMVNEIASYQVFSTLDLTSAYHQVSIKPEERKYTAFEAAGSLYQFCRIPFGVTNGVASFQRVMEDIIRREDLKGTYAYIDNVTTCGRNQAEHDYNLNKFMKSVEKYGLTLNKNKCHYSLSSVDLLGYTISKGSVKPDSDRLKGLMDLPVPQDLPSLRRAMGMFSHYSRWISNFSEKVHPLTRVTSYPLTKEQSDAFKYLKQEIAKSSLVAIDSSLPLEIETDASEHAIAASLIQNCRPVAFFSRTLTPAEQKHSSVEKEAYAIVEAIRKWRHLLLGKHFKLITDQKSVSFMFNPKSKSKIKNEKITRWKLELACFSYDIAYRPGKQNAAADALSRICSSTISADKLHTLHNDLCHPGVTRMLHFVRSKNMPYSVEDVRAVVRACQICSEMKPRFIRKAPQTLIKASQPFERLSVDFKGPLPSNSRNRFLLTVVDEYSRFPFAFPCADVTAATVKKHLTNLFSIFGNPSFVHTDRGTAFMSEELKGFLHSRGIATSRTTAFNPQGNGQVERYNGIIWQTVGLALRTRNLSIVNWEKVLDVALHCIRSLLSTPINCTPHERLFDFQRKSATGDSIPTWLTTSKLALLKRHVRGNKYEPLVETVEILEVNPNYAHVRFNNGRETTVSLRHMAPLGDGMESLNTEPDPMPGDPQELEAPNQSNHEVESSNTEHDSMSGDPQQLEAPNLSNTPPRSPLLENYQRTQREDANKLNLRRSTRIRQRPPFLAENYQL